MQRLQADASSAQSLSDEEADNRSCNDVDEKVDVFKDNLTTMNTVFSPSLLSLKQQHASNQRLRFQSLACSSTEAETARHGCQSSKNVRSGDEVPNFASTCLLVGPVVDHRDVSHRVSDSYQEGYDDTRQIYNSDDEVKVVAESLSKIQCVRQRETIEAGYANANSIDTQ